MVRWLLLAALLSAPVTADPSGRASERLLEAAHLAIRYRELAEAEKLLQSCLAETPEHCECKRTLGVLYSMMGNRDRSARVLLDFTETCPRSPGHSEIFQMLKAFDVPGYVYRDHNKDKNYRWESCYDPLRALDGFPRRTGERLEYGIEVGGLTVGEATFSVHPHESGLEYRSEYSLAGVASVVYPASGRSTSVVPTQGTDPLVASSRYRSPLESFGEWFSFRRRGRLKALSYLYDTADGERRQNLMVHRRTGDPVYAFFALRGLQRDRTDCTVVYTRESSYTVWAVPLGVESLDVAGESVEADKVALRFGWNFKKQPDEAIVWLSQDELRVPYRAELETNLSWTAVLKSFEPGSPSFEL